ncbi:holo-ACP synthase [Dehalogenimonas etheniformans]|uniref:Holo-[acyl-carrier-protein] synthase n=1 Tax=Dehalogenimonas etheniformans TaxID=1536648 RepID=A0A2P5P907_9CHLR|nr:holo-ACP synthase [Dehalogenimonas etheniformans]PPD58770.1 holo-[acyl-carrier-protein] synthase [Dehalogenimonas etheniformans]QNT76459.1 holo-ACP synthase [Dehalogenimonas etheniformans]
MKQYLGVDIIEISRIEKAVTRWGDSFLDRVFTAAEKEKYLNRPESLAARFAAKEATVKALGTNEIIYRDIEIVSGPGERPQIKLVGRAYAIAGGLGISSLAVSLSHSRDYAVAVVSGLG